MAVMRGGDRLEKFLTDAVRKAKPVTMSVGFQDGATEADGTSVAMIAAMQNFGAPSMGVPPRPFFSNMIAKHSGEWRGEFADNLRKTRNDPARSLDLLGATIAGELRQEITETNSPALSPVTLMLRAMRIGDKDKPVTFAMLQEARHRVAAGETPKGLTLTGSKPLVYSGTLLNSITSQIEE